MFGQNEVEAEYLGFRQIRPLPRFQILQPLSTHRIRRKPQPVEKFFGGPLGTSRIRPRSQADLVVLVDHHNRHVLHSPDLMPAQAPPDPAPTTPPDAGLVSARVPESKN